MKNKPGQTVIVSDVAWSIRPVGLIVAIVVLSSTLCLSASVAIAQLALIVR